MNKLIKKVLAISAVVAGIHILGCSSSVKKADIPSTANPQDEITKLNEDLNNAVSKNVDVLSAKEFKESLSWFEEAKSDLSQSEKQEEILDDLRKSRGYLDKAYQLSDKRAEKAPGLFEARQFALSAGAKKYSELNNELEKVDSDVSDKSSKLDKVNSSQIAELQERYVEIEKKAVIRTELGSAQAFLNGAKENGALKLAPLTYKKSEVSLKNAESVISSNSRNSQGYKESVDQANSDSVLLNEVMVNIRQSGNDLNEASALKMVSQGRKIKDLNKDLTQSQDEQSHNQSVMEGKNQILENELVDKTADLKSANSKNALQNALETARSKFSKEEAEAYQQGGNLLIRLKKVNFASGRSDLPGASIDLLAKVSDVAKSINATEIKIEGHTDSLGSVSQNKELSEDRASSVASYFKSNGFTDVKSVGYGFQKPLATNKTKDGRAQNRRVDIIIVPLNSTVME